jgi:hypothetical protein
MFLHFSAIRPMTELEEWKRLWWVSFSFCLSVPGAPARQQPPTIYPRGRNENGSRESSPTPCCIHPSVEGDSINHSFVTLTRFLNPSKVSYWKHKAMVTRHPGLPGVYTTLLRNFAPPRSYDEAPCAWEYKYLPKLFETSLAATMVRWFEGEWTKGCSLWQ